ncbi:MAG: substrate-binding domain-containing protein [Bacilli bacterium]
MKKILSLMFLFLLVLAGCSKNEDPSITVYTRDTHSGTRDGFFTIIEFKDAIKDNNVLTEGYVEVAGNGDMISALKNDEFGIGYISLSSLATSGLKGLSFNGVNPTEENVISGEYELFRNFNYVTRINFDNDKEEELVEAFVAYMGTVEGKATIAGKDGIVEVKSTDKSWNDIKEKYSVVNEDNSDITIRFGGSTSVEKVARALSADFSKKAGNFKYEHNHTGSSDAYIGTQGDGKDGNNKMHIGFASREFKLTSDEQLSNGTYGKLCVDAIVAVVSPNNKISNITNAELKDIYSGNVGKWSELE